MGLKNPRLTPKERNLIKGAIRRVFSRSELRKQALDISRIPLYQDPARPRVTKWSICPKCCEMIPTYLMEVDHLSPIIPVDSTLEAMSWDTVIDRIWCEPANLLAICKPCHILKSRHETQARKLNKKGLKK